MTMKLALLASVVEWPATRSLGAPSPRPAMTTARSRHTATVLPYGKVSITGGLNSANSPVVWHYLASAELYDPGAGSSIPTRNMIAARSGHSATLLPDGRVLITGGGNADSAVLSAELYDPSTGTFTATVGTVPVQLEMDKRSTIKIMERTQEKAAEALHAGRESRHLEAASVRAGPNLRIM